LDRDVSGQNTSDLATSEVDRNGILLPLTLTLHIIEILREHFLIDIVEDKNRIKTTVTIQVG
jgi:hypothetical protein